MHQSSLGTMMLLTGPKLHPLWFTPWLPFLFLVNCVIMGYGVVVLESHAAASAFGRRRETEMLGRLSQVAMGVALFFVAFRVVDIALRGPGRGPRLLVRRRGARGARPARGGRRRPGVRGEPPAAPASRPWRPCCSSSAARSTASTSTSWASGRARNWSYFPAVPELLITFGIVAARDRAVRGRGEDVPDPRRRACARPGLKGERRWPESSSTRSRESKVTCASTSRWTAAR